MIISERNLVTLASAVERSRLTFLVRNSDLILHQLLSTEQLGDRLLESLVTKMRSQSSKQIKISFFLRA